MRSQIPSCLKTSTMDPSHEPLAEAVLVLSTTARAVTMMKRMGAEGNTDGFGRDVEDSGGYVDWSIAERAHYRYITNNQQRRGCKYDGMYRSHTRCHER
jgi:hypothetical protein